MPVSNSRRCASKRAVHPEPETVSEGTGASKEVDQMMLYQEIKTLSTTDEQIS